MPAIRSHSTAVNTTTAWDGPGAMREAPSQANILRYMSAWYAGQNPDQKSSYKFPHHPPRMNAPANLRGVNNALARLPQADIPAGDRAGVEAHLRRHRKDAGLSEAMSTDEINQAVDELIAEGVIEEAQKDGVLQEMYNGEVALSMASGRPLTFEDLDAERENLEKLHNIRELHDDLWRLFYAIDMELPNGFEKMDKWKELFNSFLSRAEMLVTEEVQESDQINEQFTITPEVLDSLVAEDLGATGMRSPVRVKMALLEPGWGNKKMKRYYPAEVLKRDAHVFEGVKMYRSGHNLGERTAGDEVAVINKLMGFSQTGAPLMDVTVFDPDEAEKTRNRALAGKLYTMEASILGSGDMEEGERDGKKGFIVKRINEGISFDLVPKAGAGGRAVDLLSESDESDLQTQEESETMKPEKVEEIPTEAGPTGDDLATNSEETTTPTQETEQSAEGETEEVQESENTPITGLLSEEEIETHLSESQTFKNLPTQAQTIIRGGKYITEEDITQAVTNQVELIKELTGAGKVPALEESQATPAAHENQLSEAEKQAEYDKVFTRFGG